MTKSSIVGILAALFTLTAQADVDFKFQNHSAINVIGPEATGPYKDKYSDITLPIVAAAGDSISTHVALQSGYGHEANALVNTSSAGLIGLFVVKAGLIYVIDNYTSGDDRKTALKATSGLWGGATVNNLLIATGATGGAALAGGIVAGVGMWYYEDYILDKDRQAREYKEKIQAFYAN